MQNYYRVLGIGPTATAVQIEQAYARQRARFKRLAAADRIMKARLADVEAGFDILGNARRRIAYDLLLAQEPEAPARPRLRPDERLRRYARVARSLNAALLACFLLLALDWALPLREFPNEKVRTRFPVFVSSALSAPQLAYRVHTQHTSFRLSSHISQRVRAGQRINVWKTPLLGVVRRVSSPASPDGPEVFQPYGGTIYGTFALLPLLLGLVAGVGVWPRLSSEAVINTATVSSLLTALNLVMLMWF
ncbi:J domain-containing protein [Hymenobacter arizonensis]|uniref:J domain-containing protein n=1 Tax=Hymenobacter arizonensis TaxID=1227077 RepID=A0A1I6AYP7_HYMAR|nr:hypothetical protein [Hymenobacter arizonensis]SFQ73782.1 hypothetical protein SAMN04515668_4054 [Hymenobacter arizonensis]